MKYLTGHYAVSARRACGVIATTRSSVYDTTRKDPLTAVGKTRQLARVFRLRTTTDEIPDSFACIAAAWTGYGSVH
jgi:hypothetical protein